MVELPKTFVLLDLIRVLAWFVHAQSCPDTPHWWFVSKWSLAWSIRPSVIYPLPLHQIVMEQSRGNRMGSYGEYSVLSRILSLPSGICVNSLYIYILRFQTHAYSPDPCFVSPQHIICHLHTIVETKWVVINSFVLVICGTNLRRIVTRVRNSQLLKL